MKIYNIILSDIIHEGWLETLAEAHKYDRHQRQVTELYCNSHEELTIEDGLVYKGHYLVIPFKEHPGTAKSLHESHIGIEGTLHRARDILYWHRITTQLKDQHAANANLYLYKTVINLKVHWLLWLLYTIQNCFFLAYFCLYIFFCITVNYVCYITLLLFCKQRKNNKT